MPEAGPLHGAIWSMLHPFASTMAPAGVPGQRSKESATPSPSASVSPESEKEALKAPAPTMSAPMRSQSGARSSFRIQDCRSGKNGVPGARMGLGADSHRKSPLLNDTSGRKK